MLNDYKQRKEAFVSGLTGGSLWEINLVSLAITSSVFLWSALQSRYDFFGEYRLAVALTDFMLHCGVTLLAVTIYASVPTLLGALLLMPAIVILLDPQRRRVRLTPSSRPPERNAEHDQKEQTVSNSFPTKPFLTHYRGIMIILTCVAILAVDFPVFPRRFAKVENWGTSLMDLGVGSFVFSAGVVSARAVLKRAANEKKFSTHKLYQVIRHSAPLLSLGFIRLYSVKTADYAEHVTEYGVHWNFFFTLGLLPPFVALLEGVTALLAPRAVLAFLVAATYQVTLIFTDLDAFILTAPRTNFLSQNREGIFSFAGYLAIFLAGQSVGLQVLGAEENVAKPSGLGIPFVQRHTLNFLIARFLTWTLTFQIATSYYGAGIPVSRRLANLPYFLWVTAFNCGQLAILCACETLFFPNIYLGRVGKAQKERLQRASSRILCAYNQNGLAIFLLANLLTGLVNLFLPTLDMTTVQSMVVLLVYLAILSGVALGLHAKRISLKL